MKADVPLAELLMALVLIQRCFVRFNKVGPRWLTVWRSPAFFTRFISKLLTLIQNSKETRMEVGSIVIVCVKDQLMFSSLLTDGKELLLFFPLFSRKGKFLHHYENYGATAKDIADWMKKWVFVAVSNGSRANTQALSSPPVKCFRHLRHLIFPLWSSTPPLLPSLWLTLPVSSV